MPALPLREAVILLLHAPRPNARLAQLRERRRRELEAGPDRDLDDF